MGKKNPNEAEIAGGKTPETNAKEPGEVWDQFAKKPTYVDICLECHERISTRQTDGGTHRGQVGKNGDDEQRDGIEETDQHQQQETERPVSN